jgi:hypothetical protein
VYGVQKQRGDQVGGRHQRAAGGSATGGVVEGQQKRDDLLASIKEEK